MIREYDILSLEDAENSYAPFSGGKFKGLVKLKKLVDKYNQKFGLDIAIPETYAISSEVFDRYDILHKGVPEELVNKAMEYVVKLGGNVAVRSSADVEDGMGKTYSGQFASVLSVKNKSQMYQALREVYASAKNVEDSKMAVILQKMVDTPKIAGVAYSESWYGDPFVVLNYTKNKFADKLVAQGGDEGHLFAVGKFYSDEENNIQRISFNSINDNDKKLTYWSPKFRDIRLATPEDRQKYKAQFSLAALITSLEKDLDYPVDMEFAVSQTGQINLLQQRPYCLPEFFIKNIDLKTTSVFSQQKPIIEGRVGFVRYPQPWYAQKDFDINIWKSRDGDSVHVFTKDSVGVYLAFEGFFREHSPFSAQYNHMGNMSRENLDFTVLETFGRGKEFEHIKEGDYMRVNLVSGKFQTRPQNENNAARLQWLMKQKEK